MSAPRPDAQPDPDDAQPDPDAQSDPDAETRPRPGLLNMPRDVFLRLVPMLTPREYDEFLATSRDTRAMFPSSLFARLVAERRLRGRHVIIEGPFEREAVFSGFMQALAGPQPIRWLIVPMLINFTPAQARRLGYLLIAKGAEDVYIMSGGDMLPTLFEPALTPPFRPFRVSGHFVVDAYVPEDVEDIVNITSHPGYQGIYITVSIRVNALEHATNMTTYLIDLTNRIQSGDVAPHMVFTPVPVAEGLPPAYFATVAHIASLLAPRHLEA